MSEYNVPSDEDLKRLIYCISEKIEFYEKARSLFQTLLKLNDEGRYLAMVELFKIGMQKRFTSVDG